MKKENFDLEHFEVFNKRKPEEQLRARNLLHAVLGTDPVPLAHEICRERTKDDSLDETLKTDKVGDENDR